MSAKSTTVAALLVTALSACASSGTLYVTDPDVPRALPEEGAVSVHWEDPEQFSDIRYSLNRAEAKRGDWVVQLATYLRTRAAERLPPGERLDVLIVDIQRAGKYEMIPGRAGNDVRVYREVYPPRMVLRIQRFAPDGQPIAEGERKLTDPGYLSRTSSFGAGDALRYEKRLIDRWVAEELRPKGG